MFEAIAPQLWKKITKKEKPTFHFGKNEKKKNVGKYLSTSRFFKKVTHFFFLLVLFVFSQTHVLLLLVSRKISFPGRDYFRFSRFFRIGLIVIRKTSKKDRGKWEWWKEEEMKKKEKKVFSISPDGFWESEIYTPG